MTGHDHTTRPRRLAHLAHGAAKALPSRDRLRHGAAHALLATSAAVIAYLPTRPLGLHEGFWAAITAIAVTQTEFAQTRSVARDQVVGALIGGIVGSAAALGIGTGLTGYVVAAPAALLLAWLLNAASAARLAGITATIILLVPHSGSIGQMMLARLGEVTWGVLCGIGVAGLGAAIGRRLFGNGADDDGT